MKNKDFCCADNYSVIIPYKDLEKLLRFADQYEQFDKRLRKTDEQLLALRIIYTEALQKIADLERYV